MQETWRPIPGHAGYEVSDLGRVRSVDRVVVRQQWGHAVDAHYKGRVLKLSPTGNGYLLARFGRRGQAHVHCLVLETFVGPRPAGHQAAHFDGDRLNNAVGNLRWATPKENNADKWRHGTAKPYRRARTACRRGHTYTEATTRRRVGGSRSCRVCEREAQRRRHAAAVVAAVALAHEKGAGAMPAP